MAKVSIYLNFQGKTFEAFTFYKTIFRTEFQAPIVYMKDLPPAPDMPVLNEAEENMVMHVALPLYGDCVLMGTDSLESMGHKVLFGNNISINLEPDTKTEADRLFLELMKGGQAEMPMQIMFWGDYFGAGVDKFGVRWMINHNMQK